MQKSAAVLAILTLFVGLAVGAAAGFFLSDRPVDPESVAPATETATAPPAAAVPSRATPATQPQRAARDDSTAAAAKVPSRADRPPVGDGRITGRVTDPEGAGVSGVLVRATPRDDSEDDEAAPAPGAMPGAPPADDVEGDIRRYAEARRLAASRTREATTDANGAYELTGLAGQRFDLEAWRAGWRVERTGENSWEPVAVGGTCDFRAAPIRMVRVAVLLPDGRPAGNAFVTFTSADAGKGEPESHDWLPSQPAVEVAPGTWTFTASADSPEDSTAGGSDFMRTIRSVRHRRGMQDGENETAYRSEPVTVTVGDAGADVTLRLAGLPGVFVRAAFPPGERPRAFRIAAMRLDGTGSSDPARLLGDAKVRARWITGTTEGLLPGLAPGPWLVGVTLRGGRVAASTTVTVGATPVVAELTIPAGDWRDWVKVWVRAPDGKPVRDAELECGCRGSEGSGDCDVAVEPEPEGWYRVEHYEREAPSLGGSSSFSGSALGDGERTWFVRAKSARWGEVETDYDPATDREVTIQLFDPAIVRVTITGFVGNADSDRAVLSLVPRDERSARRGWDDKEAEIDATGHATFPPVRPGTYDVVLRLAASNSRLDRMNAGWRGAETARATVRAVVGTNEVTLAMQALSELVVTFEGDAPAIERWNADGARLRTRRASGDAKDGRITFPDLVAGRYRLVSDRGDMWVDVPASGPLAFRPRPFDCLHLEVREGSYLLELGLRTGDLVLAIDGTELRSEAVIDAAIAASKARETSLYTILRGSQRLEITADGKRFEEDDKSTYRPWVR